MHSPKTIRVWLAASGLLMCLAATSAGAGPLESGAAEYDRGHYQNAAELLVPLAHDGNPFAQFAVGVMYDDGKGLPQNYALALKWYRRAAEAGLVDAQHMMGKFYATGRGMPQNVFAAHVWFNVAAAGGYPNAQVARDTEAGQLPRAKLAKAQATAAAWQRRHPRQFTCVSHHCIHASWLPRPKWRLFDRDSDDWEN